jgi:hypothetical protein
MTARSRNSLIGEQSRHPGIMEFGVANGRPNSPAYGDQQLEGGLVCTEEPESKMSLVLLYT